MVKDYIDRIIDSAIDGKLHSSGALMIIGAKGCGKTTTAKRFVNLWQNNNCKEICKYYPFF